MKKLEPYFIMEGASDKIYRFIKIILDNINNNNSVSLAVNKEFKLRNVYIIFDQHYGDLHAYMKEKKRLEESEAKFLFRQCVEVVRDCHDNGIIIRDIKLKKFVFVDSDR